MRLRNMLSRGCVLALLLVTGCAAHGRATGDVAVRPACVAPDVALQQPPEDVVAADGVPSVMVKVGHAVRLTGLVTSHASQVTELVLSVLPPGSDAAAGTGAPDGLVTSKGTATQASVTFTPGTSGRFPLAIWDRYKMPDCALGEAETITVIAVVIATKPSLF